MKTGTKGTIYGRQLLLALALTVLLEPAAGLKAGAQTGMAAQKTQTAYDAETDEELIKAADDIAGGSNENGSWRITAEGKLIVSTDGQYPMGGISPKWHAYAESIKTAKIKQLKNCTTLIGMFSDCCNMTSVTFETVDTSAVTNMRDMFSECESLKKLDLSSFDTKKVTNMADMFYECSALTTLDVSSFDTKNVTDMSYMFYDCIALKKLDVSGFQTKKVTNMADMFYSCRALTKLDVSGFQTDNVVSMKDMFAGCASLEELDVSGFQTDNVTSMWTMFWGCSALTKLDVGGFHTKNVTNMAGMFSGCSSLTKLDVSGFQTKNVVYMDRMFSGCSSLTKLDVSGFRTPKVVKIDHIFCDCKALTALDVTGFDISNVEDLTSMFEYCESLTALDVTGFDTGNAKKMVNMFYGCKSLTGLDLSRWKTDKVVEMRGMFAWCKALKTLNLKNLKTAKVQEMDGMFDSCDSLTSLDLRSFTIRDGAMSSSDLLDLKSAKVIKMPKQVPIRLSLPESSDWDWYDEDSKKVTATYKNLDSAMTYTRGDHVKGVTLTPKEMYLEGEGATGTLSAKITPADAWNQKVTYKSADKKVAKVNADGQVTAVGNGRTTVTVTTADGGYEASCEVTVHVHKWSKKWTANELTHYHVCTAAYCNLTDVTKMDGYAEHVYDSEEDTDCNICGYQRILYVTGVTLSPEAVCLTKQGETVQLTATVRPVTARNKAVTFTSADETVATVLADGLVTAAAPGKTTITVKTADGGYEASCEVTVHFHSWSEAWTTTAAAHYHVCEAAGCNLTEPEQMDGYGVHVYDDEKDAECNVCGYRRTTTGHTHSWSEAWTTTDKVHYHVCEASGCDLTEPEQMDGYGAHIYDDEKDAACNVCGYQRTTTGHTHSWSKEWTTTDKAHYHVCEASGCDITEPEQMDGYGAHVYDDEKDAACNVCGYQRTVTTPTTHTHNWSKEWTPTDKVHYHVCKTPGCDLTEPEKMDGYGKHVYENDKDSTCNICGYYREVDEGDSSGNELDDRKDLPILLVRGKQAKGNQLKLTWNQYKGAKGYEVYWSYCDGKRSFKKLKSLTKTEYTHKNLNKDRAYKYFVVAYKKVNGRKVYLSKSPQIHVAMDYNRSTNVKSIKLNKSTLSLRPGETFQIKATVKKQDPKKKIISHVAVLRYYSANEEVAKVGKKGKIKAKQRGTCTIYVIASNGLTKKIKLTVK